MVLEVNRTIVEVKSHAECAYLIHVRGYEAWAL